MTASAQETQYRKKAREIITNIVEKLCGENNYKYNRIVIKNQRTRLGSCSSKGNLNFNWQIIKLPQVAMEYVVKHEIAHLIHQNHSKDFWGEVRKLDPNYKENHRWVRENVHKYIKF